MNKSILLGLILLIPFPAIGQESAGKPPPAYDWAVTAYGGKLTGDSFDDVLSGDADFDNEKVWVVALSRRFTRFKWDIDLEGEVQLGKHDSLTKHWEVNGLLDLRWNRFPWDRYLDTSAAWGVGLSYATEKPEFEIKEQGATNRLMAYILFELAMSLPQYPQWAVVARWHHRSAAWGLFEDDIETASNAIGLGIKRRF
ncbi:MAG: hypothetical protein ACR2QG_06480 [Gammaproteobacteria bacterium]